VEPARHSHDGIIGQAFNSLSNQKPPAKIIVWAHNSHLGDARATQMSERGELNLGQLARERFGKEAVSVGFTTYDGTVTAASDWDGPAQRKSVRPAHPESYEALLHDLDVHRLEWDSRNLFIFRFSGNACVASLRSFLVTALPLGTLGNCSCLATLFSLAPADFARFAALT
jgi:erythromycin esterase-like protein